MDYEALYRDLLSPSVRISTSDGIGSGVIISNKLINSSTNKLFILTAAHVVGNESLVNVELFNSTESLPAFVVSTDTGKDLALLKIAIHGLLERSELQPSIVGSKSFLQLPTINPPASPFAKGGMGGFSAKLAPRNYVPYIFTPVWVIGCSLGYAPRPTEGCITAINEIASTTPRNDSVMQYWEMNAPIWPGNSGGGVFLKDTHELIGIAVWVKVYQGQLASTMGGIVPLYEIYKFIDRLTINGERLAVPTTKDQQPNPHNQTPQTKKGGD
jgi:S1-C subfamily serine protease